jgi:UDP-N-acetyl-D-glucosamine dehydrogenase
LNSDSYQSTLARLESGEATIGVLGLGYVGLPLMLRFSEVGYKVLGLDIDPVKVDMLNAGKTYISHLDASRVRAACAAGMTATTDYQRVAEVDAIIICVPTPLLKNREPDLSFVINSIESVVPNLTRGTVVSLESTTYPGTTEEELLPRMESTGLKVGEDLFLVYSPEREDPGNQQFTTGTIPKLVSGQTQNCLQVGLALYAKPIEKVVPVSSTKTAEMAKLLENIHRAVNIGLVNEMKVVADRMGIDIFEVIDAAATKPFGFTPYYPGPGLGGHCIPIDPFYLSWKAKQYGVDARFIELAGEVNGLMPGYVVDKLDEALVNFDKKIQGSRILILGIAYKKNVDDMRETPAAVIMDLIIAAGGQVNYSDPHVPVFPKMRNHDFDLQSVPIEAKQLSQYDAVVLVTDHDRFDYELIRASSKLIIDTRGVYRSADDHIVRA